MRGLDGREAEVWAALTTTSTGLGTHRQPRLEDRLPRGRVASGRPQVPEPEAEALEA